MSGGVDSSVSAMMLKKKGCETAGIFAKFWSDNSCMAKRENACCSAEAIKSAKSVASQLNIPFYVLDVKKIFKEIVVDNFISEYKNLRTPNPCVRCNKFIKFGWLMEMAQSLGFQSLATGHYARIKKDKKGVFHLFSGCDKTKDQSYFLYRLNQKQLSKIIFPVGEQSKKDTWKMAKRGKIKPAGGKESQEICFVSDESYREFLRRHLPRKYFQPGSIVDMAGNAIGRHTGLINYTIGQRKGIDQSNVKNEHKEKLFVVKFDKKKNELVVGAEKDLLKKEIIIGDLSWVSDNAKERALKNKNLKARIRYRHIPANCRIKTLNKKEIQVSFSAAQRAVASGQSLVFYLRDEVLGGGIIK